MSDRTFSTKEVCELTGATYRMADYWVRIGLFGDVVSHRGSGSGTGSRRRFDEPQLIMASILVAASKNVANFGQFRGAIAQVRAAWEEDPYLTGKFLWVEAGGVKVVSRGTAGEGFGVFLNLERCAANIRLASQPSMLASR
jgi:hypothetical protein